MSDWNTIHKDAHESVEIFMDPEELLEGVIPHVTEEHLIQTYLRTHGGTRDHAEKKVKEHLKQEEKCCDRIRPKGDGNRVTKKYSRLRPSHNF